MAAGIASLELVCADGSISRLRRGDEDFDGAVVSLGALGLVTRASLDVVPAFELRQYVFEGLPWSTVEADLDAILEGAYSVSLFTSWSEPAIGQVWVKTKEQLDSQSSYFGAAPAQQPRHPIPGADSDNCTEQLGVPGPSGERLPHFRLGFTPSGGAELQSEYVVARKHGVDAAPGTAPPRRSRVTTPADSGDPDSRRRHALAQSVLRAGQHRVSLHVEAAARLTFSPSCPRSRAHSRRSARDRTGEAVRSLSARPRSCLPEAAGVSRSSCRSSMATASSATSSFRATCRAKPTFSWGCSPSCPGAARPALPRHGRAHRSSRCRQARAGSRTARSSPSSERV